MQCDIQAKKGWGPICAYITKEDKNPHIWGNTSKAHVMEVAEAYEGKKKTGGAPLLTVKWLSAPFAQGTSSENNVGDRVRASRWLRPLSVGSSIFRYGDRSI